MMSLLPDLTPRDVSEPDYHPSRQTLTDAREQPHSLWYTSPRDPPSQPPNQDNNPQSQQDPNHRRPIHAQDRSQLARLRADEQYAELRRVAAQDFGSTWLKPAGVVKTLHQMREERREQEEHQEALRREALAQELAEAEAGQGEFMPEEGVGDVMLDGAQDLDDEIPEGADLDMGFGSSSEEEEDEDEDGEEGRAQDELVTVGMRRTGDAFREALARGHAEPGEMYGAEDLDGEGQDNMLDEEDFIQAESMLDDGGDLDMEANLDDEIPEAELSGYEHTDSDAEISSSEADYAEARMGQRVMGPPQSPTSRGRGEGRRSMDLSSILSRDESSFMESSPAMRGARRQ